MSRAYYNEIDPYCAQWLRNLIAKNLIAPGDVDERSIEDVAPDDLLGYRQVHLYAGVGGWSCALRRSGWPDEREVWTLSEPCQPFSQAGKRRGAADERYLRPASHHLIRFRRPKIVFGEQVASKDGLVWLDTLHDDMEGEGYTVGAADTCSAGVGAPHIRQRVLWVAYPNGERCERKWIHLQQGQPRRDIIENVGGSTPLPWWGFWGNADTIWANDKRWRPVEPGSFPMVDGFSSRVEQIRAFGNSINIEQAQVFVESYFDVCRGLDLV